MEINTFAMLAIQLLAVFVIFSGQDSPHRNTATSASFIVGCITPYPLFNHPAIIGFFELTMAPVLAMIVIALVLIATPVFYINPKDT